MIIYSFFICIKETGDGCIKILSGENRGCVSEKCQKAYFVSLLSFELSEYLTHFNMK